MPYNKRKQKCKQSDGDSGSYVLSYTDKKGKKRRACHTSKKKMQGQIAAIEAESKVMKITDRKIRSLVRETINSIINEADETRDSSGNIVLKYEVGETPLVVFFYPGIGYGTQPFVNKNFKKIAKELGIKNTIVIIGKDNKTDFSSLDKTFKSLNVNPEKIHLGGWSGGAMGLASAQNSGKQFDKIIYADPSPPFLVKGGKYQNAPKDHKNAKMYYNPNNWKRVNSKRYGNYAKVMTDELAPQLGENAIETKEDHTQIFMNAVAEILKQ